MKSELLWHTFQDFCYVEMRCLFRTWKLLWVHKALVKWDLKAWNENFSKISPENNYKIMSTDGSNLEKFPKLTKKLKLDETRIKSNHSLPKSPLNTVSRRIISWSWDNLETSEYSKPEVFLQKYLVLNPHQISSFKISFLKTFFWPQTMNERTRMRTWKSIKRK